jgi:hypothetical protein
LVVAVREACSREGLEKVLALTVSEEEAKPHSFVVTKPGEWATVQQEMISDQMAVGVAVHAT